MKVFYKPGEKEVLLLAKHERALSEMYLQCSFAFLQYRNFWYRIAQEEETHEKLLLNLLKLTQSGKMFIKPGRFNIKVISWYLPLN